MMKIAARRSTTQRLILILCILVVAALGGCGKSKAQKEAEAARAAASTAQAKAEAEAREVEAAARQEAISRKHESEQAIQALKEKVTAIMKDPASTQFRSLRLGATNSILCGEVNAKNSYGGYVGFRNFIVSEDRVMIAGTNGSSFEEARMNLEYLTALESSGCRRN